MEFRGFATFWHFTLRHLVSVLKDLCAITFCDVIMCNAVCVLKELSALILDICCVQY
jgi:hypothetical protein